MKIQSINIKNFKGIESFKGEVGGKNVYLIGGNGTGKTSFIDAVWCGLTGKNIPPEPTTGGAKKGLIEIELDDYIARTKFTKGRPTVFEIENKNATKATEKFVKSPRYFMESKIGVLNFDIDDFFNKSDAQQLEYFAKIMDADFSEIDSEIEENSESRKFDKIKLKTLNETLEYYDPKDADKELINVRDLAKKITVYNNLKHNIQRVQDGVDNRNKRIKQIDAEIEALITEQSRAKDEVGDGTIWLSDPDNKPLSIEESETLNESLETAESDNKKIQDAKAAKIQEGLIKEMEACISENTENIENLRLDRAKKISDLISVEGLTYDVNSECFLYEGLPFDKKQINTAACLIAGMKIGASTLKDLKILKVDASLIDKDNFEEVLAWAESENIELFIELVDREATQLKIQIEDIDN
jgi:predicted ATP-dependent endonuclease of OLD family